MTLSDAALVSHRSFCPVSIDSFVSCLPYIQCVKDTRLVSPGIDSPLPFLQIEPAVLRLPFAQIVPALEGTGSARIHAIPVPASDWPLELTGKADPRRLRSNKPHQDLNRSHSPTREDAKRKAQSDCIVKHKTHTNQTTHKRTTAIQVKMNPIKTQRSSTEETTTIIRNFSRSLTNIHEA